MAEGVFSRYWDYFFSGGPGQILAIAAVLAVMAGLGLIGCAVAGRRGLPEGHVIYGWAVACFAFTGLGVLASVPFHWVAGGLLAGAGGAGALAYKRKRWPLPPGAWRAVILASPLLVMASAMVASQWDEFSHWVPTMRWVFENHDFPRGEGVVTGGAFPGYPYNWIFLPYLSSLAGGRFLENAGGLFNPLLLIAFGFVALRAALIGAGRDPARPQGWTLAALAVMAGTLLNPTFVQKIVLTAYSDPSTAVCVGFGAFLGWRVLEALAAGDREGAFSLAWQFGLVLAVLINIKQANLVLGVIILFGYGVVALRDPAIRVSDAIRMLPAMALPAVAMYGLWRYHLLTELSAKSEAVLRPIETWNWEILDKIVLAMLSVASKKGVFFGLMLAAVGFALRGLWRCRGPFDRLSILIAALFLGYNTFLLFVFIAQFGKYDAARVASYWRYNMHLGLLAVLFGAYGLGLLWRRWGEGRDWILRLAWVPVALILIAPVGFAYKLRFDLEPRIRHYRLVGAEAATVLPEKAVVTIMDPHGTGESAVITRYEIGLGRSLPGYMGQYHWATEEVYHEHLATHPYTHMITHTVNPALRAILAGHELEEGRSYLFERKDEGWRHLKTWAHPEGMKRL